MSDDDEKTLFFYYSVKKHQNQCRYTILNNNLNYYTQISYLNDFFVERTAKDKFLNEQNSFKNLSFECGCSLKNCFSVV